MRITHFDQLFNLYKSICLFVIKIHICSYRKFPCITHISRITRTPNSGESYNPFLDLKIYILVQFYSNKNPRITRTLYIGMFGIKGKLCLVPVQPAGSTREFMVSQILLSFSYSSIHAVNFPTGITKKAILQY